MESWLQLEKEMAYGKHKFVVAKKGSTSKSFHNKGKSTFD
jgi:hypothetical protein|tara:strand:+ start:69 stop:188 length:120 start_codon:yes stop_codon:yes gene_type:complete